VKFDLRSPCVTCPFRTDVVPFLHPDRAAEILHAITHDKDFICHKTVHHDSESGDHIPHPGEQHCAGALIFLERLGRPNQMMRIAERLRFYDRKQLRMDSPVFATARAMIKAQSKR